MNVKTTRSFGIALCQHFGIPSDQALAFEIENNPNEIFSASVKVALTASDLAEIARRMDAVVPLEVKVKLDSIMSDTARAIGADAAEAAKRASRRA